VSEIDWVSPDMAAVQLANFWGIPLSVAEEIVRNVIEGGRVEVRARRRGRFQQVSQIVTGQIQLLEGGFWARDYDNIEMDWNGLLVEGRKLVPADLVVLDTTDAKSTQRKRLAREPAQRAIDALYPAGVPDQSTEPNSILCRKVGEWLKKNNLLSCSSDTILPLAAANNASAALPPMRRALAFRRQ
jgi:hypothetical protein